MAAWGAVVGATPPCSSYLDYEESGQNPPWGDWGDWGGYFQGFRSTSGSLQHVTRRHTVPQANSFLHRRLIKWTTGPLFLSESI